MSSDNDNKGETWDTECTGEKGRVLVMKEIQTTINEKIKNELKEQNRRT